MKRNLTNLIMDLLHLEFPFLIMSIINLAMGKLKPLTDKEMIKKNEERCKLFSRNPYFDSNLVVGKSWRIYMTWGGDLQYKCVDIRFKYADELVIERIADDMSEFLAEQPEWHEASLVQYTSPNQREMLLFPYRNISGRFEAVSNMFRGASPNFTVKKGEVPLLKYFLKLLLGGRFLLIMDCHVGFVFLLAKADPPPYRADLEASISDLGLEDGIGACIQDKNENESFLKEIEPKNKLIRY